MSDSHSDLWPIRRFAVMLRAAGFRVGAREYEHVLVVLSREAAWPRERLRNVLSILLKPQLAEHRIFDAVFDVVFPPEVDPVGPFQHRPAADDTRRERRNSATTYLPLGELEPIGPPPMPPARFLDRAGVLRQVWTKLLSDRVGRGILVLLLCGLPAALLFLKPWCHTCTPGIPLPDEGSGEIPIAAWAFAAFAAAGVFGPFLLALRWITRTEPVITPPLPAPLHETTHAVFRIGLVGGASPMRVNPERMKTIVDLFAYNERGEDEREMDVERTVAAVIAAGGMPEVRYSAQRLLPLVLILTDAASPGRQWNTTSDELAAALGRRGLRVRHSSFDGSLHAMMPGAEQLQASRVGRDIKALSDADAYAVIMIFSDGAGWREEDTRLVASVGLGGPVLWFDDRDRELWDCRLDGLRRMRIPIYEATDRGIEEALRSAYAPGRGIGRPASQAGAALVRRLAPTIDNEVLALLGSALGWARHCSLLQPISAALAEEIRRNFHPDLPWITFSRLCALPGSTIGPEGLRFNSRVRSFLLASFAAQEPEQLRDQLVAFITQALKEAGKGLPEETTAYALCRFAIERVAVHSRPDAALREILEIRAEGLIAVDPIDDFLARLRPIDLHGETVAPGEIIAAACIPIGKRLREAESIALLAAAAGQKQNGKNLPIWEISSPELRIAPQDEGATYTAAAFAHKDELAIAVRGRDDSTGTVLIGLMLPSGTRIAGFETVEPGSLDWLAARDGVVVAGTRDGRLLGLLRDNATRSYNAIAAVQMEWIDFVFACPRRRLAAAVGNGVLRAIGGPFPLSMRLVAEGERCTAVCEFDAGAVLLATASGRLGLLPWGEEVAELGPPILPGPVTALAVAPGADGSKEDRLIAAAYSVGSREMGQCHFVALLTVFPRAFAPSAVRRHTVALRARPLSLDLSAADAPLLIVMEEGIEMVDTVTGLSLLASAANALLGSLSDGATARVAAASFTTRRLAVLTDDPMRLDVRRLEREDSLDVEDGADIVGQSETAA